MRYPIVGSRLAGHLTPLGRRQFLIELEPQEDTWNDQRSRGVSVQTIRMQDSRGRNSPFIVIDCLEASGHNLFDLLGAELAVHLQDASPKQAIQRVLSKWRRFWGQVPSELLSREAQIGLFAEVWFLRHWMLRYIPPMQAVQRWRGPLRARNDFEWTANAIEVKGSSIIRGSIFRIHGLDQLEPPPNTNLHLFTLRMREDANTGIALPALIKETLALLQADCDALGFAETLLIRAGYSPAHEREYETTRWRVTEERLYPVSATFPCLRSSLFPEGLPPGVTELAYTLDLTAYTGPSFATPAAAAAVFAATP